MDGGYLYILSRFEWRDSVQHEVLYHQDCVVVEYVHGLSLFIVHMPSPYGEKMRRIEELVASTAGGVTCLWSALYG